MNYYKMDEDSNITQAAEWKFEESCLETQEEIIRGYDGNLYFASSQPLEDIKQGKLSQLTTSFAAVQENGHLTSSLGFEIDATERSNSDVMGLIITMNKGDEKKVLFCDYHNKMRVVTLEDLKILRLEIISYGQKLYAKKWMLREKIENSSSLEELKNIDIQALFKE